jgi:aromatic ring-opening dioxygenase catalytic subunit (LigB family)
MSQVPYDIPGDPELARLIADEVAAAGSWMTPIDDPYLPIHYPTVNLLPFLQGPERWISVSTAQTADTDDFLLVGAAIGRAVARSGRRVVLLASGAMSHTFWKLKELRDHEGSDPVHIRTPEARRADLDRLAWFEAGDHARVVDTMPEFLQVRPEAMFGHYLMMVGSIGGRDCVAPGVAYSEYENAIGTGQVHVWFARPAAGWT